jgi:hypothetical protein
MDRMAFSQNQNHVKGVPLPALMLQRKCGCGNDTKSGACSGFRWRDSLSASPANRSALDELSVTQ